MVNILELAIFKALNLHQTLVNTGFIGLFRTDYLNINAANRAHLDAAIAQVNQANLIKKTPTELGL